MGKKKYWRMLEGTMVRVIREVSPIVDAIPQQCKFCDSRRIVRYGHYQQVQRWWCKDCKRKFVHNQALPKMKTPTIQVALALSEFYQGSSLNDIRRNLLQTFGNYPSDAAVYYWIVKFTKMAVAVAKGYKADVGDTWVADETVWKIGGEKLWFWDIIDDKTRFLLASHISVSRTIRDARILVERAAERADKTPKVIITDKLAAYLDGIERAFVADTRHIPAKALTARPGTQLIERVHVTLKSRTKVMRGLKSRETAKLFTDGWLVYYNFFKPHEGIGDKTPAEKAGITFPFKNCLELLERSR